MSYWLSKPATLLYPNNDATTTAPSLSNPDTDTLIIGSGYGAAMAAIALSSHNPSNEKIWVLERGQEYVSGDFPKSMADTPAISHYTQKIPPWPMAMRYGMYAGETVSA